MGTFRLNHEGRYVRSNEPRGPGSPEIPRPNFPPRLIIPDDTRHPVRIVEWERWGSRPREVVIS